MKMQDYESKCQAHIDQLSDQMAVINDKKNIMWLKLRKQKVAYKARLRNRQKKECTINKT